MSAPVEPRCGACGELRNIEVSRRGHTIVVACAVCSKVTRIDDAAWPIASAELRAVLDTVKDVEHIVRGWKA